MLSGLNHLTPAVTDLDCSVVFYFLDPDGHKIEAHVGDLVSRLEACRQRPYAGMKFFTP
ncbi:MULTISPECIES: hypothetical protein [Pseudomonas]|uniref:hypothetical protein n=1 Tax=Pseudomonas sp. FW306-2-11AD TaxID=2070665 RepID=UPI000A666487|nr:MULTISPECIES: hypothetical protein [Pseudomonas]